MFKRSRIIGLPLAIVLAVSFNSFAFADQSTPVTHYGFALQLYEDPLMNYQKTGFGSQTNQFTYTNMTGLPGLQAMFYLITPSHLEFSSGLDYAFSETLQGAQSPPFVWSGGINMVNQNFTMMGLRLLQVGYRLGFGPFSLVPYGGIGVYYGRNVLTLSSTSESTDDVATYSKIFFSLIAGTRFEYHFLRYFAAGLGLEIYQPIKYQDQFSQNGTWVLEGYDNAIESNMDFADSVGGRVYLHLASYF